MSRGVHPFALALTLAALAPAGGYAQSEHSDHLAGDSVPLFDNLGTWHHPVSTSSALAQRYFDQGLRLTYGFNHAEAIRAFTEATRLDSNCAMCYWGIAYALGPNINAPMDSAAVAPAYQAIQKAVALSQDGPQAEQAYIQALARRYSPTYSADRTPLDSAYANAMRKVAQQLRKDPDAQTLFAESLLDLSPWNQWTKDGKPTPGTLEIVATLEEVLATHSDSPGACHYYIHTVEASYTPERALPCAERLPSLMPGAGHLVHMPGHIYLRLGRYQDAVKANQHAVHADQTYIEGQHPTGIYPLAYYPHNNHFLMAALSMLGRGNEAIEAARNVASSVPLEAVREVPVLEYWMPQPYFALVRFDRWDAILADSAPPRDLKYTTGMWHYARGMALAAKGRLDQARAERDSVTAITATVPEDFILLLHPARSLLGIADHVLGGEIAGRSGNPAKAVSEFQEAVRIQDGLSYDEPPPWYFPVRQALGAALLNAGRPREAEAVYRQDLKQFPENGWSLYGLAQSLKAQKKSGEAAGVQKRFDLAWAGADDKQVAQMR